MQVSSLIGKNVLTRAGECLGYVLSLRLTRGLKAISCLVCVDADEEEFFLPMRAVLSAEDAVIAGSARLRAPTGTECPVGRPVYSHTGEFLGHIGDVDTGESPALLIRGGKEPLRVDIACAALGETVIVYPSGEERRSAGRKKSGTTRVPQEHGTKIKQTSTPNRQPPASQERAKRLFTLPTQDASAQRIDRTNLLGRRVKRSVFDETGKAVALAGERITPETLARARRCNRLLALTVNTLTNLY